jgi:hypothetical protein
MVHSHLDLQLRGLLGTMLLVPGNMPSVRYGHAHPHHVEHEHYAGTIDDIPILPELDHDLPALKSGTFHWPGSLPGRVGLLDISRGGTLIQIALSAAYINCCTPVINSLPVEPTDLVSFGLSIAFTCHPPPGFQSAFRIPSESGSLTPLRLQFIRSVLIRC